MKKICVYCAANEKVDQIYKDAAYDLGREIASSGNSLIYGGGASGLMGAVARGCADYKGHIIGVVPDFISEFEPVFEIADVVLHTKTMATRKEIMEHNSDMFIILPGGVGTLDEMFQIIVQKELDRETEPIIIYNVDGFYDKLAAFLYELVDKKFVREKVRSLVRVCNSIEEIRVIFEEEKKLES